MNLMTLKIRIYFAWQVLRGKYEPAPITPLDGGCGHISKMLIKAEHELFDALDQVGKLKSALRLALSHLEDLGQRQYRGCARKVRARAAHSFIVTQLEEQGVTL